MLNTVNPDNFNETMKGYIVRAMAEAKLPEETRKKIFQGLNWATSEMTMEDARREWQKYCQGKIEFK
jgi:truncated hemoglobin YjbI